MTDEKKESKQRKFQLFVRILNVITALVLIGFGFAGLINMFITNVLDGRFFLIFSPLFLILFGLLLLVLEFRIKFILKHVNFCDSFLVRGIFNFYLSSSVFFYFQCGANATAIAWTSAIIIFVLGCVYCVMHCCLKMRAKKDDQKQTKQQML